MKGLGSWDRYRILVEPTEGGGHKNRAGVYVVRARRLRLGQDPEAAFTAAQAAMDQAIRQAPKCPVQRILRARIGLHFADFATKKRPARERLAAGHRRYLDAAQRPQGP